MQLMRVQGHSPPEVLLINDGSNAYFIQYGDVYSNASLFTLSSDINLGKL